MNDTLKDMQGRTIHSLQHLAEAVYEELHAKVDSVDAEGAKGWFEVRNTMTLLADLHEQAGEQYDAGMTLINAGELTIIKSKWLREFEQNYGQLTEAIEAKMAVVYAKIKD